MKWEYLKENIEAARSVGMRRVTVSLTLEEAEELLKIQHAIDIICQSTQTPQN